MNFFRLNSSLIFIMTAFLIQHFSSYFSKQYVIDKDIRLINDTILIPIDGDTIFFAEVAAHNINSLAQSLTCKVVDLSQTLLLQTQIHLDEGQEISKIFIYDLIFFLITKSNSLYTYTFLSTQLPNHEDNLQLVNSHISISNGSQISYCYDKPSQVIFGFSYDVIYKIENILGKSPKLQKLSLTFPNIAFDDIKDIVCSNNFIGIAIGTKGAVILDVSNKDDIRYIDLNNDDIDVNGQINVIGLHLDSNNLLTLYDKENGRLSLFRIHTINYIVKIDYYSPFKTNKLKFENFDAFEDFFVFYWFDSENKIYIIDEYKLITNDNLPEPRQMNFLHLQNLVINKQPDHLSFTDDISMFENGLSSVITRNKNVKVIEAHLKNFANQTIIYLNENSHSFLLFSRLENRTYLIIITNNTKLTISELRLPYVKCQFLDFGTYQIDLKLYDSDCSTVKTAHYCIKETSFNYAFNKDISLSSSTNINKPNENNVANITELLDEDGASSGNLIDLKNSLIVIILLILLLLLLSRYKKANLLNNSTESSPGKGMPITSISKEREKKIESDEYLQLEPLEGEELTLKSNPIDVNDDFNNKESDQSDSDMIDDIEQIERENIIKKVL